MRKLIDHQAVAFEGETAAEVMAEAAEWAKTNMSLMEVPTISLAYGEGAFELVLYFVDDVEEP